MSINKPAPYVGNLPLSRNKGGKALPTIPETSTSFAPSTLTRQNHIKRSPHEAAAITQKANNKLLNAVHTDAIKQALSQGADINTTDSKGLTALMKAAREDFSHLVKSLLAEGADHTLTDVEGKTALDYARQGRKALVKDAIENPEDPITPTVSYLKKKYGESTQLLKQLEPKAPSKSSQFAGFLKATARKLLK